MVSSIMAVSKRMAPVNVFGFVRYDQGNRHPSTNVRRQGGAINSGMQFDERSNTRRMEGIRAARQRVGGHRSQAFEAGPLPNPETETAWTTIANKLGGPHTYPVQNWGRVGEVTDVVPLTDLHYRATAASWHVGGGPLDPVLDGEGIKEYATAAQPVEEAKSELAEAMKPAKKPRKPKAKIAKVKMPRPPRKFSKKGGFIFTKLYVPSVTG